MIKIYKLCMDYLQKPRNRVVLLFYILLCFGGSVLSLGIPYISGRFVDYLATSHEEDFIFNYCFLFGSISLGAVLLGFITNRINILLPTRLSYELNRDVIAHVQKLPLAFFYSKNLVYLTQRINGDVNALVAFCISAIQNFLTNFVAIIFAFLLLWAFSPLITGLMCVLIAVYYLAFIAMRTPLFQENYEFKEAQSEYFGKLYEQISNIEFLKQQAIADLFLLKLNSAIKRLLTAALRFQGISYLFTSVDSLIITISNIFLFILGGTRVIRGELTIGQFTILTSYFSIMMKSVRYFFSFGKTIQDNMVSYYRLQEIMQIKEDVNGLNRMANIDQILIQDLSFSYLGNESKLFNGLRANFQKGNIYAYIGANGSGKTTLAKLIAGLYTGSFEGDIRFDGISIHNIDMEYMRRNLMGVSEQEPELIKETICYNLYFKDTLSEEDETEVFRLIDILELNDFIDSLPEGIYSKINDSVDNISGGEKQKLSLLRVFVKNPQIIILDEPTSALDTKCQKKLRDYLLTIKENKIIIIITHDENLASIADKCVYFPIV